MFLTKRSYTCRHAGYISMAIAKYKNKMYENRKKKNKQTKRYLFKEIFLEEEKVKSEF